MSHLTSLSGTEFGRNPSFSPDGQWILFEHGSGCHRRGQDSEEGACHRWECGHYYENRRRAERRNLAGGWDDHLFDDASRCPGPSPGFCRRRYCGATDRAGFGPRRNTASSTVESLRVRRRLVRRRLQKRASSISSLSPKSGKITGSARAALPDGRRDSCFPGPETAA